jgi:hypothetical protein
VLALHIIKMSLTPEEIQYMKEHISDNKVAGIITANVICIVAAYIAVALRLYARRLAGIRLGGDDWWIITALVGHS